jgi:8-oxo-dGTP diphosphatase
MIQVAVGIIISDDRANGTQVLLCQRKKTPLYGLKWEFPGGKLSDGESPEECMRRELHEELGITVEEYRPYHQEHSFYPDGKSYDVQFYLVSKFSGTPNNLAFEQWQWVRVNELSRFDILSGNANVVQKLVNEFSQIKQ